jgi:hypothetical protein
MVGFPFFAILYRIIIRNKIILFFKKLLSGLLIFFLTGFLSFSNFALIYIFLGDDVEALSLERDWPQIIKYHITDAKINSDSVRTNG